jgi:hypothetical protein
VGASKGFGSSLKEAVVYRSCLLVAVLAMLVSAAPARAGGSDHRAAVLSGGGDTAKRGHGDRVSVVPTGLAGAPLLTAWWRELLAKPAVDPTNPFAPGGCRAVAHGLALMYPTGHCTIRQGTSLFAVGITVECSNLEPDPFHADTPLEAALCGLRHDLRFTEATLTVDERPFPVLAPRFGMFMLPGRVTVPERSVFDLPAGETMRYGGHGYVAFIRSLPVGRHTLHTHFDGPDSGPVDFHATITVRR